MWKTLIGAAVLVAALLGLSEFLHTFWMRVIRPKTVKTVSLVLLSGQDCVAQLHYAGRQMNWYGRNVAVYRLAVPTDEPSREACRLYAARYDMTVCAPENLETAVQHICRDVE